MAFEDVELPDVSGVTVGILGGTGAQGRGLGYRLVRAGHRVTIGSRDAARARDAAAAIAAMPGGDRAPITGGENAAACDADVVIVAVPWPGHGDLLTGLAPRLAGRIVVDCVNPLGFDERGAYPLEVEAGSAAEQAAALLPESRVTAAFHHVSATLLTDPEIESIATDILVLGDDRAAAATVQALATRIEGMRGVFAGRLRNAGQVEALTANLIAINRRYRAHVGIRVTDI
ncbi:reduced coenzyme F420:NADP oxidoreductase [Stackebrandtia albiflava]|uniref:Reduced coenzyme F420:NADP oxidoreductase n=1 Tax=Stackebrandtia albiflava TaxID=406432 RepID=A0A562UQK8_9ACTN|nr:NADPH-dependent F420 reductase [Stackebrandtia albiflava]TWJ07887.1 reduced coenzyme F420:NADP oxidoreductase [Stackebrandtia albiflava]